MKRLREGNGNVERTHARDDFEDRERAKDVPVSLTQLFGEGIRKIPVNPFDIVTQYDPDSDAVNVLGLVHQRMAR